MNKALQLLSQHIEVIQCKNNKQAYIAKECPFCGAKGKRVFRYNVKLKVGKFFCCGRSFKEEYWLRVQLKDKNFAENFRLDHRHGWYKNYSDEKIIMLKEKLNTPEKWLSRFVKFNEDNLPF